MKAWRWPILALVVALLVAATVIERGEADTESVAPAAVAAVPTASRPGALGSTWFCAAGTAVGDDTGEAEQIVHLANASADTVQGRVTVYPSEAETVSTDVSLVPLARVDLRVSDIVRAPFASVLVELDGGEVAVQHELVGPSGRSLSACASAPAASWYFPQATTRAGAKLLLTLFNPFPTDAVVDVNLEAEDGARTPQAFQGLVVPGGRATTIDVGEVVTLRQELATAVNVRSGRVVAEQVQIVTEAEGPPPSLAAMLGAPRAEPVWLFPDGIGADAYEERFILYNPSDFDAEVDLEVLLDDPETNGVAEPFEVAVQPRRYAIVDVFADGRVPVGVAHAAVVRSRNDVPVVAQRVVVGQEGSAQRGLSYTLGSPVVAARWLAPVASVAGASGAASIVYNPSPTEPVVLSARMLGAGRYDTIEGLDGATLAPLGRIVIDIGPDGLGYDRPAVEIEAQGPVVVETRFGFEEGTDLSYLIAVPVVGTVEVPTALVGELSQQTVVLGGE